jgi:two-component system chemotaxis response regulator CheY
MEKVVLITDDSPIIRGALKRILSLTGLSFGRVLEAADGRQALEALAAERVDLLITDIHMPEMDGLELLRAMRKRPELPRIPAILISSDGASLRSAELDSLGVHARLGKPFRMEAVRDAIQGALGGWNGK